MVSVGHNKPSLRSHYKHTTGLENSKSKVNMSKASKLPTSPLLD